MAGRNPQEAYKAFIRPVRESFGCITKTALEVPRNSDIKLGTLLTISTSDNSEVKVEGKRGHPLRGALWFYINHNFTIVEDQREEYGPYRVTTRGYKYQLFSRNDDAELVELIGFHWDRYPAFEGLKDFPHMHIASELLKPMYCGKKWSVHKKHVPTDRILLESFVRMIIEEFGGKAQRANWQDSLQANASRAKAFLTH